MTLSDLDLKKLEDHFSKIGNGFSCRRMNVAGNFEIEYKYNTIFMYWYDRHGFYLDGCLNNCHTFNLDSIKKDIMKIASGIDYEEKMAKLASQIKKIDQDF